MDRTRNTARALRSALLICSIAAQPLGAVTGTRPDGAAAATAFRHPDLHIPNRHRPAAEVGAGRQAQLAALGAAPGTAFYDARGGHWGTLLLSRPLVPGSGRGNTLQADAHDDLNQLAWSELRSFVEQHQDAIGVDPVELTPHPAVTIHEGGDVIQIHAQRVLAGIPVRDTFLSAVINHGNLVLMGTRNWGDATVTGTPGIDAAAARAAIEGRVTPLAVDLAAPELTIVPLAKGPVPVTSAAMGDGYDYRLAWSVKGTLAGDPGHWEGLVDATDGALLFWGDTNVYASRRVGGGVFPVSNDGTPPDGVEQAGFPMPFADAGGGLLTSSAGTVQCVDDPITTTLDGRYIQILDNCGPVSETAATGDLDLGTSPGTDCETPPGASLGNTHASRTGFYELNRIMELGRGWLPENNWLRSQVPVLMNVPTGPTACNAFWAGENGTMGFFRSDGTGFCFNSGEIAAVFDHEWGHGMDDNDANGGLSIPFEAIADTYAFLRLHDSCIGRGFLSLNCAGYLDECLNCTGVRDVDWDEHDCHIPHDIDWILTDTIFGPCGGCLNFPGDTGFGPCGQATHCEGYIPAEAAWDLVERDLRCLGTGWEDVTPYPAGTVNGGQCLGAAAPTMSRDTAYEIGNRLTFLAAGNIVNWYQCDAGTPPGTGGGGDGCNADGGYLNYLAVDDDDGDLTNGTPHMSAIFEAFDRHQIACGAPTVQDSGCAVTPATAPLVSANASDQTVRLSWGAVPDAEKYWVFRTEGVFGCDFGKARIAEVTGTSYQDENLGNGFEVHYAVLPVGADDSCIGPMSSCRSVTPGDGGQVANLSIASAGFTELSGDGDAFLDNCESASLDLSFTNSGSGPLTDLRVTSVSSPSHPGIVTTTSLPITVTPSLAECGSVVGSIPFLADGLAPGETVVFDIEATTDELHAASGDLRTARIEIPYAESDPQFVTSQTWSFETDMEGWQVASGTFTRSDADATAAGFYLASSSATPAQCDTVRSPVLSLTPTSTLSLSSEYDVQAIGVSWYDRANVGVRPVADGPAGRVSVSPDLGRVYNASGVAGNCVTNGEPGWAGPGSGWLPSLWSATALGAPDFAGELVQLEVGYGTDTATSGDGFRFDEVTLTDFHRTGVDTQDDVCSVPGCGSIPLFGDTFLSGDFSAWDGARNPDGLLDVNGGVGLDGSSGLTVPIGGPRLHHLIDTSPPDVDTYCWSFLFDVASADIDGTLKIFGARAGDDRYLLGVRVRQTAGGGYQLRGDLVIDGGVRRRTPWVPLADGPVLLGGTWTRSDGGDNGSFTLSIDGGEVASIPGLDNDHRTLGSVGIGYMSRVRASSTGSPIWDAFDSGTD